MDSIAKTSLLTAAMRAAETKLSPADGRLFVDPYAELLAGEEGMSLRQTAIDESGDQPAIAIRTAFMDRKMMEALQNGAKQIVMLAAGMDTRCFRLTFPPSIHFFELDRQEVLDYKQSKLKDAKPQCHRHAIGVDLRDDWQQVLINAGFQRGEKTLWMVEGLLMYLEESQVRTLFGRINGLAVSGDFLLLDVLSQTLLDSPFMKKQLDFLVNMGAPWKFGVNEPEEFFKTLGWNATVIQTGEFIPSRWPFPVAPREIPHLPRGFLVEAVSEPEKRFV